MPTPHRILVVDGDATTAFALREKLLGLGDLVRVEVAASGREALRWLQRQPFDLVLSDMSLPGMDGLQLLSDVRHRYPLTGLMLMGPAVTPEIESRAHELNLYAFLLKPFHAADLLGTVRAMLDGAPPKPIRGPAPAAAPAARGRHAAPSAPSNRAGVTQRLNQLWQEMGAQGVMLVNLEGEQIATVGSTEGLDGDQLASLAATSISSNFAIADLARAESVRHFSYLEGRFVDIYTANVGRNFFLLMVFPKDPRSTSRMGSVYHYTRRALSDLETLLAGDFTGTGGSVAPRPTVGGTKAPVYEAPEVAAPPQRRDATREPEPVAAAPAVAVAVAEPEELSSPDLPVAEAPAAPATAPATPKEEEDPTGGEVITFEEAVRRGLIRLDLMPFRDE